MLPTLQETGCRGDGLFPAVRVALYDRSVRDRQASAGNVSSSVCVIGAGPCGLTTLKNLAQAGLQDIVCYETGSQIGGNWVFRDEHGHSSIYETTHTISSKTLSQFDDFPMPGDFPDFPSHKQILAYFQAYDSRFDLKQFIRFRSKVLRVKRENGGGWQVTVESPDGEEIRTFDNLMVCSGHHWDPHMPALSGNFSGSQIHAHDYKCAEPFRDSRVLVVGGGNSACDIAVETSRLSRKTCISMRRGYYIIPKIIYGKPVDVVYSRLLFLPKPLRQRILGLGLRIAIGRWEKYNLKIPDCGPMEMHPTLNSEILYLIRHGKVHPRGAIAAAEGNVVTFEDGSRDEFDTIVWATGYRTGFPFLGDMYREWRTAKRLPLYLKMIPADPPNLYFIGLFQPIGCIWTLADYQARIAALQISGDLKRPKNLRDLIKREMDRPHWRFPDHPRHAVEVDYHDFKAELLSELKSVTTHRSPGN